MSEREDTMEIAPIIVVKRGGGHHDEHHGGVWKIAFADFMTAMMAFFLVMWLVNAANEETKVQVASYFNPIKLTDTRAVPKGVRGAEQKVEHDAEDEAEGLSNDPQMKAKDERGAKAKAEADVEQENAENKEFNEEALFKDPYAVLAEIAGDAGQGEPVRVVVPKGPSDAGLSGGEAFRDPFDPSYWQHGPGLVKLSKDAKTQDRVPQSDGGFTMSEVREFLGAGQGTDRAADRAGNKEASAEETKKAVDGETAAERDDARVADGKPPMPNPDKTTATDGDELKPSPVSAELARLVEESGLARGPQLSVEGTGEGVLVRLTDGQDFSMFSLSSAQPSKATVRMMDRLARILNKSKGRIIIRGHTDGRPFRSGTYDNWRLSTARAHMAYHMLVRGGVGKDRFVRIEGRADRDLKAKGNPLAAENRRIEILIQDEPQ